MTNLDKTSVASALSCCYEFDRSICSFVGPSSPAAC